MFMNHAGFFSQRRLALFAVFALALALMPEPSFAFDIGNEGGSVFSTLIKFLQDTADFVGGPLAKFLLFVAIIIFVGAWIWAPQAGALGGILRVVIGVAIVANAGLILLSFFGGGAGG